MGTGRAPCINEFNVGGNPGWTSITSISGGEYKCSQLLHAIDTRISSGPISHLGRTQT